VLILIRAGKVARTDDAERNENKNSKEEIL